MSRQRRRPTIAGLMALVALVAVGLAGFQNPSDLWASALYSLAVGSLTTAVLGAAASQGRARLIWTGFALFGWVYLALSLDLVAVNPFRTVRGPQFVNRGPRLFPDVLVAMFTGRFPLQTTESIRQIVHSIGSLLCGAFGAYLATKFADRTDRAG
jgi:hypothetical protein